MTRSPLAIWLFCLLASGASTTARAAPVTFTAVGTPSYMPTDFHLFTGPIGTAATGYAEFTQTQSDLLPPPNHVPNPVLGIGPGAPHAGPYDKEFAAGVAANGFVDASTFTTAQYSNGKGVYLVFMLVPSAGAPTGSSPDFASGPIMPNASFPLTVNGSNVTNGAVNDVLSQFQVPPIDQVPGFEQLDGFSHIPFFFVDNFDFASNPVPGSYEYQISLIDAAGNGFDITAPFQIVAAPEPATWMLTGIGSIAVIGIALLRRRREAALEPR